MDTLAGERSHVLVRQVKEWGNILLGVDARNRFEILGEGGEVIGQAAEEGTGLGATVLRNVFGRCRVATVHLYDRSGRVCGRGAKPFRWYFHRLDVYADERLLGTIERRFAPPHRKFVILDAAGAETGSISSSWFRIWTFRVTHLGREVGFIRKRWRGLLQETFTDAVCSVSSSRILGCPPS